MRDLLESSVSKGLFYALVIALAASVGACGSTDTEPQGDSPQSDATSSSDDDSTSNTTTVVDDAAVTPDDDAESVEPIEDAGPEEEEEPIGEPMGDTMPIDHAMVRAAIEAHMTAHIDGIDEAISFLETSDALTNLFEVLIGSDDGDDEGDDGEGDDGDEPVIEIDLSGFRADFLEWTFDYVVHESTATPSDDGLMLTYPLTAEVFCVEEAELEDWMDEAEQARQADEALENEAECAEQLAASPLSLMVTTDGEERLHLTMVAGTDATQVFALQLHDDMLAGFVHLAGIKALLQTFIDAEDFEFPDTMTGTVGVEVMNEAEKHYALRVTIEEALEMADSEGQDSLALNLAQNLSPGWLVLDGAAGTVNGQLALGEVQFGMAWEMIVGMTWDDEGSSEWVCETNAETGEEDCWEEWTDGPEKPEVSGMANLTIPGVAGAIMIDSATDTFHLQDVSLGEAMLSVDKDGQAVAQVELNPDDGWIFDIKMIGEDVKSTRLEMASMMDAKVVLSMDHVKDSFQDLPDFMMADTMGVMMQGEGTPSMTLMRDDEDDVKVQVTSGQLTLWSDAMDDDVVIEAGQCITEIEAELTEEEEEAQHDLFGGLGGGSCE
ncbi:MAG: hypothetical protein ACPGU1_19185 [Myxococcota bacterium]